MRWRAWAVVGGSCWVLLGGVAVAGQEPAAAPAEDSKTREERLWQHRNLGKALYENPATQYDAVDELRTALELAPDSVRERINLGLALLRAGREEEGVAELERAQAQDPSVPHTWFNLGIAYKRAGEYEKAIRQLEGMLERVRDEARTHYNLGVLHKLEGDAETSLRHFERAAELDPGLAGPWFQLAAAYRQAGRAEDAARAMETFREIKQRQAGAAVEEDLEWSWYSELYDVPSSRARLAPTVEIRLEVREVAPGASGESETSRAAAAGLEVLQADGEPAPDLVAWGPAGVRLLSAGREPVETAGLGDLSGVHHVAAGDLDGDGRADLAVVTGDGLQVLANRAGADGPVFEPLPGSALPEAARRAFDRALWVDVDHDYDPDLLLLGTEPALLRNDGDGTFTDRTERFPFADGSRSEARVTAAAVFDLVADSQGFDVAVALADGTGTLYRDLLGGVYEAEPLAGLPAGAGELLAADLDHDGWTDLLAVSDGGVVALHNVQDLRSGGVEAVPISDRPTAAAAVVDLDSRGAGDLALTGSASAPPVLLLDRGGLRFEEMALPDEAAAVLRGAAGLAAADFDGDGLDDVATVAADGAVHLLTNATETPHGHLRIALEGVKNPKLAAGSEIEVKAGSLYQKMLYRGVPLTFGLAGYEEADAVRITWPNGLIQNEVRVPAGTDARYEEAPRLSGSCPMIFTWNGEGFEFITDVLGVAPLGASAGDGEYFPVDHDEVIRIAGESLVPRTVDGESVYEVRITEELREVAFLDRVRLLAVDRPPGLDVFVSDKFVGPPFPSFRLYGVEDRRYPVAARDHRGNDVLERVTARDRTYPDGFARDASGLAELHHLELTFDGPVAGDGERGGEAILVLHGWVDWADGSTFLASSQGDGPYGSPLVLPSLQAKDASGRWVTVVEDMGLPAGKPKTIVVDLTGKLPPLPDGGTRELRIVTSACVYWDEIFLAPSNRDPLLDEGGASARLAEVPALGADLSFRGFSRPVVHPERKQPETFVYADRLPITQWNQTSGLYTRFGAVGELLATVDDRFVVMGSGDEVRLRFDAAALDPPPEGWRRDFLLAVDGWAKDGDANTAHSQTVGPLPYRGMPRYPYKPPHAYPDGPEHRRYVEEWLTRPALRVHQPLRPSPAAPAADEPASGER